MEHKIHDLTIQAEAAIQVTELDERCLQIVCDWQTENTPELTITWQMPLVDLHFCWHPKCGKNRHLVPDWSGGFYSRVSSGAPVICLYNLAGQNRMTAALSDALSESCFRFGVNEETGMLLCRISIALDGHNGHYSVVLRRDWQDVRYEQALADVSRWWEAYYPPMPAPQPARQPMYSTWYSYHQQTIAQELEAECAQAAGDGFGCVIVDDGWQTLDMQRGYAYCGDWEPLKIPDMKTHVERIHALGMKYLLWYSVPFVGKYSRAFQRFRDQQLTWNERLGAAVLDPRFPEVRSYLIGIYRKAMTEWDLDGFKLDFIDSFCATREAPPYREGMDCRTVEEAVVRLMTGVMEALRKIKPDVMIEFRQSYIGPAMRLYGNMFRVGDCPDDLISNRVGMVDLRLLMGSSPVHSDMLMWHPDERLENAAVQIQNVLFAVPQISVRLAGLPEKHRQMLGFWMAFIRKHSELLAAPIRAESPQQLYPVVRTRLKDEAVAAVYQAGCSVTLDDAQTTYLINAGDPDGIVAEMRTQADISIFDCMGQKIGHMAYPAGLQRLPVPLGGYAEITVSRHHITQVNKNRG